jgi:hypothetical protein
MSLARRAEKIDECPRAASSDGDDRRRRFGCATNDANECAGRTARQFQLGAPENAHTTPIDLARPLDSTINCARAAAWCQCNLVIQDMINIEYCQSIATRAAYSERAVVRSRRRAIAARHVDKCHCRCQRDTAQWNRPRSATERRGRRRRSSRTWRRDNRHAVELQN